MQFLSQNPDHHFTSYSLKSPELTLADKILAKGILTCYPQFKCIEMKQIKVSPVVYEMLQELSKKKRMKPDLFAEMLIQEEYARIRRLSWFSDQITRAVARDLIQGE